MPADAADAADALYIGCMSGTSLDGLDCVAARFPGKDSAVEILAHGHAPYPHELERELRRAALDPATSIDQLCQLDARLGDFYGERIRAFIAGNDLPHHEIAAIGLHGQTLRHAPDADPAYSLQIGDAHRVATACKLTVVSDFRRRDIALGGEGAPLTPAFHAAAFRHPEQNRVIVNIGGIANLTWLPANPSAEVIGYDSGPGNCLIDHLARELLGEPFDRNGAAAARGRVDTAVLKTLMAREPYFERPPPKSTGTDHFSPQWLQASGLEDLSPADQIATVTELTAVTIAQAVGQLPGRPETLHVCGGGARNDWLMQRIGQHLPSLSVTDTSSLGLDPQWVEAAAFAWLARQNLLGLPGNLPSVTRARSAAVLGSRQIAGEKTIPVC
ncbi:MAG TPA: anhydro-N-acetylmuramic acid kinase [Gammaproteobacteria bacterium]|nr:anhydro-N-acetylmuramic acid kinase [Gammaproteobacteria bacterium]